MGQLRNGFHFLGVNFVVSQNTRDEIQDIAVLVHPRSCCRARDKVVALRDNAVHPALIQRYLCRWASWWIDVCGERFYNLIIRWVDVTGKWPSYIWLGRGLLLGLTPISVTDCSK